MFIPKRIVYFFSLFLLLALILAPVSPARASPVRHCYVNDNAAGANNGDSWTDAYTSLQSALGDINCTEIWVAEGVYYPGAAGNRTATFTLKNGVAVYGGFAGTESSRDDRDWTTNKTILSGDIDKNDTDTDGNYIAETWTDIKGYNAYHVVTGSGTDNTAVLDGFVITAGQANGSGNDAWGGGMYSSSGSPTLTNVTFSGNSAKYGGGMYNDFSSPTLTNVTFSENLAVDSGGGMYNESDSSPTLMDVTFSSNSASYGGGMENDDSSKLTLTNVTFSGNSASYGGGMYNDSSNPTLTNVAFSGNSATYDGGGMFNENSNPTLTNVTFSGNSADNSGGGMDNYVSSPTLTNVIMWGDSASTNGPEIYNDDSSAPVVTYSDIQGCGGSGSWNSACGADSGYNIDAEPLFVYAKGPDNTAGTADDNLRLGFGSPAIETGTNTGCPVTDLDSLPRPADGDGNGMGTCDMGAYEAGQMFCSVAANTAYTFDKNSNMIIATTATLGDLSCLYVDEMELNHPNATDGIQTGRYWLIRGLQSDKQTNATGFSVNLTLPTTFTSGDKDKVCRYDGAVWDCAMNSFTTNSITRNGVTAFSDWAVGNDVGPTAIKLQDFHASSPSSIVWLIPAALAIAVFFTKKQLAKP